MGKEELKISKPSGAVNPLFESFTLTSEASETSIVPWPHVYRAS